MGLWRNIGIAASLLALAGGAAAQRRAAAAPEALLQAQAAVARFTRPTLTRFESEEEFRRYVAALHMVQRMSSSGRIQFARAQPPIGVQTDSAEPVCPATEPDCLRRADGSESIMVTGSRVTPRNPSITNNQMQGVEEGDIVKQIDDFLLVLQDGRIFVIDTTAGGGATPQSSTLRGPRGGRRLALADRMNVYRNANEDMWYDEMLVFGDRVLITGYSYREEATELNVFRLSEAGRLSREGRFYISSNDYYSGTNYATRLIGDNLVIYTPYSASALAYGSEDWPVVRRWLPDEEREAAIRRGRPLFDGRNIYRPVQDLLDPTVHTVSVCPLGPAGADRDLECRATAFVGPPVVQWYVTASDAFLWMAADDYGYGTPDCRPGQSFAAADIVPALLYRVPVSGAIPGVVATRGAPIDQFSLLAGDGRFRALLNRQQVVCDEPYDSPLRLAYMDIPLDGIGQTLSQVSEGAYAPLPGTGSHWVANRFSDTHLIYGGLSAYRRGLPTINEADFEGYPEGLARARAGLAMPPAYVMPVGRPRDVRPLAVRHTVIRAEQAGNGFVLTGYRDRGGLIVTLIDPRGRPRIASQVQLEGRFESEGRSHAFTSLIAPNGSGVMGLPTVGRSSESNRASWRSRASDLSFLEVDRRGQLTHAGELERRFDYGTGDEFGDDDGIPGYKCEVSCIDWYGNSRPIFTDGRIFALSGTELIEGRISGGAIHELQRLNIALASAGR